MICQNLIIMFVMGLVVAVVGKPSSFDVFEARDDLNPKQSDVVKRKADSDGGNNDINELSGQKISLSALIDNIESGLLQTALSVENVASDPTAQIDVVTPTRLISKRSTVEDEISTTAGPVVLVQTTEKVEADDAIPAHVVIDRVSVYKAPTDGTLLFPTFHLHEPVVSGEAGEVLGENKNNEHVSLTTPKGTSSEESAESSESSESSSSEEVLSSSTTTSTTAGSSSSVKPTSSSSSTIADQHSSSTPTSSSVSSTSSTSTTTQLPVNEKQAAEKELKEKVAEVEAEPVILTARV